MKGDSQSHVLMVLLNLSVLHLNFPQGLNTLVQELLRQGSEEAMEGVPGKGKRRREKKHS